jgi:hypothetical protein
MLYTIRFPGLMVSKPLLFMVEKCNIQAQTRALIPNQVAGIAFYFPRRLNSCPHLWNRLLML